MRRLRACRSGIAARHPPPSWSSLAWLCTKVEDVEDEEEEDEEEKDEDEDEAGKEVDEEDEDDDDDDDDDILMEEETKRLGYAFFLP